MRRLNLRYISIIAFSLLAACATNVAPTRYPEITFTHLAPIKLDVAEIVYSPRYQPPVSAPNVGHEFPTPPAAAVERWIKDRLVATGSSGHAKVTIRQASATENRLKIKKGLSGAFTTDQSWRYDAQVDVAIEAVDPNRKLKAVASTSARQSNTVAEDASLLDREDVWFALTEKLMRSFDGTFETQIRKNLAKFIK